MIDLEKYLEKNILVFLDGKIQKNETGKKDRAEEYGLYMVKDYLKELNSALDNDELSKAKRLFDDLKSKYSKYPKNSSDRKKTYEILEKMYEKIQEYVEIKEGKIEVITEGNSKIFMERDKGKYDGPKEINITNNRFENVNRSALPIRFNDKISPKLPVDVSTNTAKNISDMDSGLHKGEESLPRTDFPKIPRTNYGELEDAHMDLNDITDKLLYDFRKKFEEDEYEQNQKIDALRKEIYTKVTEEVYKIVDTEKNEINDMIEKVRKELLDQIYQKAKEIVTTKDNIDQNLQIQNNNIQSKQYDIISESHTQDNTDEQDVHNEDSHASKELLGNDLSNFEDSQISSKDIFKITNDEDLDSTLKTSQIDNKYIHTQDDKYSKDNLKMVYEQAVYKMFDNKYDEAASLFRKIIEFQPNNKAAAIRLQECVDNDPSIASKYNIASDELIEELIKPEDEQYINLEVDYNGHVNLEFAEKVIGSIESDLNLNNGDYKRKYYNNDELQKMYEQGIYIMFQNNYEEAVKIFQDILRIRPENKAAKIRLQECVEAMNNA